ncbi:MAG: hypothetical protein EBU88_07775 [Acidobacteria bacterium]|nr:hypothetical protein [Acidobacteriota bacterium]
MRNVSQLTVGLLKRVIRINHSILPIIFVTIGGVIYHLAQKSIARSVSPLAVVIYAYATGIVLCLVIGIFETARQNGHLRQLKHQLWLSPSQVDWAVLAVGFGAVMIEIGFLLTYRFGWSLSSASVVSNIATALVLLPVGLFVFQESLNWRKLVGIAFCLTGIFLLARR